MDDAVKKILGVLNAQIDSNELSAAIKADNFEGEYAISEDGLTSIISQTKELLTLDSAIANPTVIERINKEYYPNHVKTAYKKFDDTLLPLLKKLGIDHTKYEFISDSIADIEEKLNEAQSKGGNKDVIDTYKTDIAKLNESLLVKDQEAEDKIKAIQEEYAQKELYTTFVRKATEKQWADAYSDPDLKDALLRKKWDNLKAKAHLKLSESGDIQLFQLDMPDKELYEGNKIATFQSMLEPELEPYLKKSSPEKANKSEPKKPEVKDDLTPKQRQMIAQKERYGMVS